MLAVSLANDRENNMNKSTFTTHVTPFPNNTCKQVDSLLDECAFMFEEEGFNYLLVKIGICGFMHLDVFVFVLVCHMRTLLTG